MNSAWQVAAASFVLALVVAGTWRFDGRRRIAVPAIGVFDWSDVWFLMIVVWVFPLLQYAAPLTVGELLTSLLIVAGTADLIRAAVPTRPIMRRAVPAITALTCVVVMVHSFSDVPRAVIGDLLLIPVVVVASLAWAQTGMQVGHLIAIVMYLTVFDVVATPLSHIMRPLLNRLGEQQPQLIFTVPGAHGVALLGIGDVLVVVVVPLVVRRHYGAASGRVAAALCVLAYVIGMTPAAMRPGVTIPLMLTLGPATLLAIAYGQRQIRRRVIAPIDQPAARRWNRVAPQADLDR